MNTVSRLVLGFLFLALSWAGSAERAQAIDVQSVTSESGIKALLVEDHSNPVIAMRIAFRGGSALDPAGMSGLANMVSGLIDEGAGPLDSQAFQGRLEDLSISLRFATGLDTFRGSLTTLTRNRDEAFRLLRLALTEPRFDAEPVDRIRNQILASLRRQSQDPDSIARILLFEKLFGDHPYAKPREGTEESVAAITTDAMRAFTRQRFARNNLVIGVAGDITRQELAVALDDVFSGLPATASSWALPDIVARADGDEFRRTLDVAQNSILFAQNGLKRSDPDYYAAYVLNYILGGGSFVSRLYEEVREKRGLAYSVYSYLAPYDYAALILGGAGTATERVGETVQVVRDQWQSLQKTGISAEELENARTYLTGSYPLRFSSSAAIANMLAGIQLQNLGADYFDKRNSFIATVSLEDINRVALDVLDPDSLTFVVVGR